MAHDVIVPILADTKISIQRLNAELKQKWPDCVAVTRGKDFVIVHFENDGRINKKTVEKMVHSHEAPEKLLFRQALKAATTVEERLYVVERMLLKIMGEIDLNDDD